MPNSYALSVHIPSISHFHYHSISVDRSLFQGITKKNVLQTRKLYESQVPALWGQGMHTDSTLIQLLSIGHTKRIDLLQHLSDDYARWRIKKLRDEGPNAFKGGKKLFTPSEWANPQKHKHFARLKDVMVKVWDLDGDGFHPQNVPYHYLVDSCVILLHFSFSVFFIVF